MVNEVGQLATLVDLLTCRHDALGKRTRTTTEDSDLAHLWIREKMSVKTFGFRITYLPSVYVI